VVAVVAVVVMMIAMVVVMAANEFEVSSPSFRA
jgi:hypothetical protein